MHEGAVEDAKEAASKPIRYVVVWLLLLALTALTYFTSRLSLGGWSVPVALGIAVTKATLVVLFFMHLWESQGSNRLVFVVAMIFVALLVGLSTADMVTRYPLIRPDLTTPAETRGER